MASRSGGEEQPVPMRLRPGEQSPRCSLSPDTRLVMLILSGTGVGGKAWGIAVRSESYMYSENPFLNNSVPYFCE